jgi:hypothetical protein
MIWNRAVNESPQPLFIQPPPKNWLVSRLRVVFNHIGATGVTVATAGHARWVAPFRVEYTTVRMPLRNLPPSLEGFRIIQITDMHTGGNTPVEYLRAVIARVNEMDCDLVCVTGDLVSHDMEFVNTACDLLASLRAPVVVTFGNHDYSTTYETWTSTIVAEALQHRLRSRDITVLRNQAMPIERADGRIWLVGMEDLWSGLFSPQAAFAGVDASEPMIVLSHSPDTVYPLEPFGPQWILAGHTHGGQIRIPIIGPLILPIDNKKLDKGQFQIGRTRMYVSRGVGCRVPVRFRCPPEVTTFVLEREL